MYLFFLGEDADLCSANTVHVDAFLYDEEEEDRLVEEGKLVRAFCKRCGSKDTEALRKKIVQFIYHHVDPIVLYLSLIHI